VIERARLASFFKLTHLPGLPLRPRITGPEGLLVLKQIRERLSLVSLSEEEYIAALDRVSESIVGGAAYDALIAQCALKSRAGVLLTWNVRDFRRLGAEVARLVRTPAEL
jgi:predicted nucleic acid-binding protein